MAFLHAISKTGPILYHLKKSSVEVRTWKGAIVPKKTTQRSIVVRTVRLWGGSNRGSLKYLSNFVTYIKSVKIMSPSNYHHLGSSSRNPHMSDGRIVVAW